MAPNPPWLRSITRVSQPGVLPLLVYDGDCGFCRAAVRRLRAWWPAARVRYVACRDPDLRHLVPELPAESCLQAATLIDVDGEVYQGADIAPRFWQLRDPAGRHLAIAWGVPGLLPAMRLGYGWIARNRAWISHLLGTPNTPPIA